ncbi:MAG TPA: ABC transporter permease [Allosphingosinicella sp.]|jgi:putative ABC transport system permease protein
MFRNYFTVGFRALAKNRTYAFINICGLAIGMAACLLILLFVRYEMSYDTWIPGSANTYQLETWYDAHDTGHTAELQMTSYPAGDALKKDFPEVEGIVYAFDNGPVFLADGQATSTEHYLIVGGNFLEIVQLPLLRGQVSALDAVGGAVMTRSEAIRRFGTDDVLGRTFTTITKGQKYDFRIGGILKDLPKNSHMKISALLRMNMPSYFASEPQALTCWSCENGWVYVRLKPGTDPKSLEARFPAWEKRNIPDQVSDGVRTNAGDHEDWHLVNVADVHLGKAQIAAMTPGNDRGALATFGVIALLILGMAVVNFTNLATARASQRAREVALRKVLGATRRQLVAQFVGESLLVAMLAMLIALALVELLIGPFAAFLDADIDLSYFGSDGIILPVLLLVLVVGVLGGLYPAFFLSRFQPAQVLKANKSAAETPGSGRLRSILVVGQFAVSIGLIICTAIIYAQTVYARTVDPGYKRDHILQVNQLSRYQLIGKGELIAERVRHLPGVDAVGETGIGVGTTNNNNTGVLLPGSATPIAIGNYYVDSGFLDAMGMKLLAGRWFDDKRPADDMSLPFPLTDEAQKALVARGSNIVINELAARRLGFANPADAVGKIVRAGFVQAEDGLVPSTIIGVVQDARFRSIRQPIDPIIFMKGQSNLSFMVVRFHGDPVAVRSEVERAWRNFTSEVPFDAQFSDDIMLDLYKAEDARAKTFAAFAILSVIVGCLGLFGLAAFTAERRTKEIGIRKVLGARVRDIVRLLVWQFSKPVIVANLIAWPVAWWLMRGWLNGFDTRIALGPGPFLLAGGLALGIAIATVAGHAFRVARSNPVHALRYE